MPAALAGEFEEVGVTGHADGLGVVVEGGEVRGVGGPG